MVEQLTEVLEATTLQNDSAAQATALEPYLCPACQERFENPKIFPRCSHSVCGKCATRLDPETHEVTCSRCQYKCLQEELLEDRILNFLLNVTGTVADVAVDDASHCANCEQEASLFCTTCEQPLCERCREVTHATKMFASHTIVPHLQYSRGTQNKICPVHEREYVMYSMDSNRLLCMTCFSLFNGSGKSRAVDLDCAVPSCTDRLKASVAKLDALQVSVLESIDKIEGLLEETEQNACSARDCIEQVISKLDEKLEEKRQTLLEAVDRQKADKLHVLETQLKDLTGFHFVVKNGLETGNVFSGSTNVHQFLDLVSDLIERMDSVFEKPHQLFAVTSSQIGCHYSNVILKCVDEVLGPNMHSVTGSNFNLEPEQLNGHSHAYQARSASASSMPDITNGSQLEKTSTISYLWRQRSRNVSPDPLDHHRQQQQQQHQSAAARSASLGAAYANHCQAIVVRSKALDVKLNAVKKLVEELHRDVTYRRCKPGSEQIERILEESGSLKADLDEHEDAVFSAEDGFQAVWTELMDNVQSSKHLYQSNVDDVETMLTDLARLVNILVSIQPFIGSLQMVTEQIHPMVEEHSRRRAKQEVMSNIFDKISSATPNTQQRVVAIQTAEDLRLTSVERKRSNPLEENLIKTKESLKSRPQVRRGGGSAHSSPVKEVVELPSIPGNQPQ